MDPHPPIPAPGTPGRGETEQRRARALANNRRTAMLLRMRRIRRSVAAATLAVFTAAFLTVYVQLASGHDPALSKTTGSGTSSSSGQVLSSATQSTGASSSASSESSSASSESSSAGSESSSGSGESSSESSSPATVTTKQS
jgi:hypothetical protein